MNALSEKILKLQGNGDYDGVVAFLPKKGTMDPTLAEDLARLADADIATDVVFKQGIDVLQESSN